MFACRRDGISATMATMTNLAPWLAVSDADRALDFYTAAFGATAVYRAADDAGTLQVAHLTIDDADFWLQRDDDAPARAGDGSIRMILTVEDPDAVFARAIAAGGAGG